MPACSEDAQSDNLGGEHHAVPLLIVHAGEYMQLSASAAVASMLLHSRCFKKNSLNKEQLEPIKNGAMCPRLQEHAAACTCNDLMMLTTASPCCL
jgi:hypothetical protein